MSELRSILTMKATQTNAVNVLVEQRTYEGCLGLKSVLCLSEETFS